MVDVVQLVRASDCGSECRGFESHLPPRINPVKRMFYGVSCFCIIYSSLLQKDFVFLQTKSRVSGNLVGISINLCKSIQKELFINDTP